MKMLWAGIICLISGISALSAQNLPQPTYTEPAVKNEQLTVAAQAVPLTEAAKVWFKASPTAQAKFPIDITLTRVKLAYAPTVYDWKGYIYSGLPVTINRQEKLFADSAGVGVFAYREDGQPLAKGDVELTFRVMGVTHPVVPRLSYQRVDVNNAFIVKNYSAQQMLRPAGKPDTLYFKNGGAFWIPGASLLADAGTEYLGVLAMVGLKHIKPPADYLLSADTTYEVYAQVRPTAQGVAKGLVDEPTTISWWGGGFTSTERPTAQEVEAWVKHINVHLPGLLRPTTLQVYNSLPPAN